MGVVGKDPVHHAALATLHEDDDYPDGLQQRRRHVIPEHVEQSHEHREARSKKKYNSDSNFKLVCSLRNRINKVLRESNTKKSKKTMELTGCTVDELKKHIEKQFKPGMNWSNHSVKGWHIDHIQCCASFDLTKEEEQKKCFHYTNLQPLWAEENLSKGAKV